ncbi:MAG: D-aminoacyl-tRNA deacylase [Bacteroidia bacterium]
MRAVIQRVSEASVTVNNKVISSINNGLLVLLGIEDADTSEDITWLIGKLSKMRIFSDSEGKMNLSLNDCNGSLLLVSQFTLHAMTAKGNRPSFMRSAKPEKAIPVYEEFIKIWQQQTNIPIQTGEFGADMKINLLNDGPVTIIIDSKAKE